MKKKKIYILVGTRPNFIKVTRFKDLAGDDFDIQIIHTGQHFDANMADVFFQQLNLQPDYFLEVGGMSPTSQIGEIILRLEELIQKIGKPNVLIVPGDVNSTLAGAIVANKMGIKLAHLESGLRSEDARMPEEHNRILTDYLANICFVTEPSGLKNLKAEKNDAIVHYVGNTMIDTLVHFEPNIEASPILENLSVTPNEYVLVTFHRPSNVDNVENLSKVVQLLTELSELLPIVLPLHPRTLNKLKEHNLLHLIEDNRRIVLSPPMGYFEFQKLIKYSKAVITDSGGIQEETTFRQVPCLTVRENTERPVTIALGTNTLVRLENTEIMGKLQEIINGGYKKGTIPKFWDGKATERILALL